LETDGTTERAPTTLGPFETETMRASTRSQYETTTGAFVTSESNNVSTSRPIVLVSTERIYTGEVFSTNIFETSTKMDSSVSTTSASFSGFDEFSSKERTSKAGPFFVMENETYEETTMPFIINRTETDIDLETTTVVPDLTYVDLPHLMAPHNFTLKGFLPKNFSRLLSVGNNACDNDFDCDSDRVCLLQSCVDLCKLYSSCENCFMRNRTAYCSCSASSTSLPYGLCPSNSTAGNQISTSKKSYRLHNYEL